MMADMLADVLHEEAKGSTVPGFPEAPHGWSLEMAAAKASELGVELTDDHWEVVRALQHYFTRHEFPNRRELTDALDERFHNQGGSRYLYRLFPGGPVAHGCLIAGLEPPSGSVDKSFGSVV